MEKPEIKYIIIVGDWIVDEYWFFVRHFSDLSSHKGLVHYRITSSKSNIVRDLCGAGHVARVLYNQYNADVESNINIIGIGLWNDKDTKLIKHLIHARTSGVECNAAKANYFLTPEYCEQEPKKIKLHTLDSQASTVRVIRSYHKGEEEYEQVNRVDWELEKDISATNNISIKSLKLPPESKVAAIVIYDQNKGTITTDLINKLGNKYQNTNWFVKTKKPDASWLESIKKNVKVFLIGPEITSLESPWERWIIKNKIGLQGLKTICKYDMPNTIVLSDKRELIGKINEPSKCVIRRGEIAPTKFSQLGWSSAFFACLIYTILQNIPEPSISEQNIIDALHLADEIQVTSSNHSTGEEPRKTTQGPHVQSNQEEINQEENDWNIEKEQWGQTLEGHGIIKDRSKEQRDQTIKEHGIDKDNERLEVWRGSPQIRGYIACIDGKKEIIDNIGRSITAFASRGSNKKPLSILLQADPGSGKTYLAKSLANAFGFTFLSFDITQMVHRDELLDMFDMVATRQVSSIKPVLVFVDEINAPLDGQQVYGAFLSPLEDGIFKRQGNAFTLKPSIWIFAGTKVNEDNLPHKEKLSDFRSRMSIIELMDYKSLIENVKSPSNPFIVEQQARLEQVYLAALIIKGHFPDVNDVSYEVLDKFFREDPSTAPARSITRKLASLRNVQYGHITKDNWPTDENWPEDKDGSRPIKLIFE